MGTYRSLTRKVGSEENLLKWACDSVSNCVSCLHAISGCLIGVGLCPAGPYFYLPKMQSHLEARLWNDVFVEAQAELSVPRGSIRVSHPFLVPSKAQQCCISVSVHAAVADAAMMQRAQWRCNHMH